MKNTVETILALARTYSEDMKDFLVRNMDEGNLKYVKENAELSAKASMLAPLKPDMSKHDFLMWHNYHKHFIGYIQSLRGNFIDMEVDLYRLSELMTKLGHEHLMELIDQSASLPFHENLKPFHDGHTPSSTLKRMFKFSDVEPPFSSWYRICDALPDSFDPSTPELYRSKLALAMLESGLGDHVGEMMSEFSNESFNNDLSVSPADALEFAFSWDESKRGFGYWASIHKELLSNFNGWEYTGDKKSDDELSVAEQRVIDQLTRSYISKRNMIITSPNKKEAADTLINTLSFVALSYSRGGLTLDDIDGVVKDLSALLISYGANHKLIDND